MRREQIPIRLSTLTDVLKDDRDAENVAAILTAMQGRDAADLRDSLKAILLADHSIPNRLSALEMLVAGLDAATEPQLLEIAERLDKDVVGARVIQELGNRPNLKSGALLLKRLKSSSGEVRSSAVLALLKLGHGQLPNELPPLLSDSSALVRRDAARAAGQLKLTTATNELRTLSRDPDAEVRRESLGASNTPYAISLNGKEIHARKEAGKFQVGSDRFTATLRASIDSRCTWTCRPKRNFNFGFARRARKSNTNV
jgi:hypothetical protein